MQQYAMIAGPRLLVPVLILAVMSLATPTVITAADPAPVYFYAALRANGDTAIPAWLQTEVRNQGGRLQQAFQVRRRVVGHFNAQWMAILRWPDRPTALAAARHWVAQPAAAPADFVQISIIQPMDLDTGEVVSTEPAQVRTGTPVVLTALSVRPGRSFAQCLAQMLFMRDLAAEEGAHFEQTYRAGQSLLGRFKPDIVNISVWPDSAAMELYLGKVTGPGAVDFVVRRLAHSMSPRDSSIIDAQAK